MRDRRRFLDLVTICLASALAFTFIVGCGKIPIPSISDAGEPKYSYNNPETQRSLDKMAAYEKLCAAYATNLTNHNPVLVMKWPHTWLESAKELFGIETEHERWKKIHHVCMQVNDYNIK